MALVPLYHTMYFIYCYCMSLLTRMKAPWRQGFLSVYTAVSSVSGRVPEIEEVGVQEVFIEWRNEESAVWDSVRKFVIWWRVVSDCWCSRGYPQWGKDVSQWMCRRQPGCSAHALGLSTITILPGPGFVVISAFTLIIIQPWSVVLVSFGRHPYTLGEEKKNLT